jgi:hypothetical protein
VAEDRAAQTWRGKVGGRNSKMNSERVDRKAKKKRKMEKKPVSLQL